MDGAVTRPGGFRGGPTRGVGAGAGHLLVEALIPSRRLPRLWQHSGAGCVLSWTPRSGTRLQPQCDGDGTTRSGALGSGCRTSAGKVDATLPNFYLELAERVGFEPTCPLLAGKTLSRRPRYDRFGTSPRKTRFQVSRCQVSGSRRQCQLPVLSFSRDTVSPIPSSASGKTPE